MDGSFFYILLTFSLSLSNLQTARVEYLSQVFGPLKLGLSLEERFYMTNPGCVHMVCSDCWIKDYRVEFRLNCIRDIEQYRSHIDDSDEDNDDDDEDDRRAPSFCSHEDRYHEEREILVLTDSEICSYQKYVCRPPIWERTFTFENLEIPLTCY